MTTNRTFHGGAGGPGRPARRRAGFSLTELMIAIGILAIGLAMIAALFPTALEVNRRSTREILGSIICENGIALTKMRFASGAVAAPPKTLTDMQPLADDGKEDYLTEAMCRFPTGDMTSAYGVVILYRRIDESPAATDVQPYRLAQQLPDIEEGHQLVAVSYKRLSSPSGTSGNPYAANPVIAQTAQVQYSDYKDSKQRFMSTMNKSVFRVDSPLIDRRTGQFARITQAQAVAATGGTEIYSQGEVERPVDFKLEGVLAKCIVVQEQGQERFSPAMSTMVTRLGLDWK